MRTAHFYWGNSPMTWLRYMSFVTFQNLNPGWEVKVHTCTEHEARAWNTGQAIDEAYNEGDILHDYREDLSVEWVEHEPCGATVNQMADLVRWETLASEPCVFFDCDIAFANPIDAFMDILSGDALMCDSGIFRIAVVSSGKDSALFSAIADKARSTCTPTRYQSAGVEPLYLVAYDQNIVARDSWGVASTFDGLACLEAKGFEVSRIPKGWLHHYDAQDCLSPAGGPPADLLGVHWSGGSDSGSRANRILTPGNLADYEGSPLWWAMKGES